MLCRPPLACEPATPLRAGLGKALQGYVTLQSFFWSPNNDLIVEPLPEFVSEERPSRYEASVSGFVYSSGRKEDVDTYGGTGDDRAVVNPPDKSSKMVGCFTLFPGSAC